MPKAASRGLRADTIEAMEEQPADSPLRLDAPREEALARAAKLIEQAWRSFDRFRPEEPPLDERVRARQDP